MVMDALVEMKSHSASRFGAEVSDRLRQERKRAGMTLKQVAEKTGTTPQTIQRIETNNMTVSAEWIYKIATAIGIDPKALLAERPKLDRKLAIGLLTQVNVMRDDLDQLKQNLETLLKDAH